jgi:hypothetical protein
MTVKTGDDTEGDQIRLQYECNCKKFTYIFCT